MKNSSTKELFSILKLDKKSVQANQKRNKRLNSEDIALRRQYVSEIISHFQDDKGRPPREREIIEELEKTGFRGTHKIVYGDRKAIAQSNAYVEDLFSIDNYSQFQEENRKWIDFVINKALDLADMKWTQNKTITKETKDGEFIEEVETEEIAGPKAQFLRIILEGIRMREEHADGKNKKLGIVKLGKRLRKSEEQIFQLEEKNRELEKELKEEMRR